MAWVTEEEKMVLEDALQVYMQMASRQMPPEQIQKLAALARGILTKLDSGGGGEPGSKPKGITDEWYENVCAKCDKLSPGGCTDKITIKYPGKCDPILLYERNRVKAEQ